MAKKPRGSHCVNCLNGKTSHLMIRHKAPFPEIGTGTFPSIQGATVKDGENDFVYKDVVVIAQPGNPKRLALKIVSDRPVGGGTPLEGLLTITLQILISAGETIDLPITDVPVDYVEDPAGP